MIKITDMDNYPKILSKFNIEKNYLIFGDIHSRIYSKNEFIYELNMIVKKNKIDKIIFLGDYIDKGDYPKETLETLSTIKSKYKDDCILIKGNHDDFLQLFREPTRLKPGIEYRDKIEIFNGWKVNGAEKTMKDLISPRIFSILNKYYKSYDYENFYGVTESKTQALDFIRDFYDQLIDFYESDDFIFTHSGSKYDNWTYDITKDKTTNNNKLSIIGHINIEDDESYKEGDTFIYKEDNQYMMCDSSTQKSINAIMIKKEKG